MPPKGKKKAPSNGAQTVTPAAQNVRNVRYDDWYKTAEGHFALMAQESMVRKMTSGWPRRGHNLLVLFCGSGHFLESFWQSGFDVTGQEHDPQLLQQARDRLGQVADFTQGSPEHLPFDDGAFDYVVCLGGLEFSPNPRAVLGEMFRLATLGVLLSFPNSWSLHGLHRRFSARKKAAKLTTDDFYKLISPLQIYRWLHKSAKNGQTSWLFNMMGPRSTWKVQGWHGRMNLACAPAPFGAFGLVRIDLAPALAGNQLLISNRAPLAAEAASSGLGRMGNSRGNHTL